MGRADIFIQRETVSRNGSSRGRPGDAGGTRDGGGEIPRRVGERLGPTARVSKDQARSVRDERPGAPRLREPGIPHGTPLYGEATRVSLPDMLGVAQLTTKGLNNGAIVFGDAG